MSNGRTLWFARDVALHRRELVIELGASHGPVALAALDVLHAWAKEQRAGGRVKGGYRALAREAFCEADTVRAFVTEAATIGVLDEFEAHEDGRRFECRVSGWQNDQEKAQAASRQQAARDRRADPASSEPSVTDRDGGVTTRDVTDRDKALRAVTPTRVTGQDRTGEPSPLKGEVAPASANAAPTWAEQARDEAMAIFQAIPASSLAHRGCPVDVFAVEQTVVRHQGKDFAAAARDAIVRAAEPSSRQPNLPRLLGWALENQDDSRRSSKPPTPLASTSPKGDDIDESAIYARSAAVAAASGETWEDR